MKTLLLTFSLGLVLAGWTLAESRTWTQASTGKTIDGELTEIRGDKVRIKTPANKMLDLPIGVLAEADKTFISEWQKAKATGGTVASGKPAMPKEGPVEVTVTGMHLCCKGCKTAVEGSLGTLTGVVLEATSEDTLLIKAEDAGLAKTAMGYIIEKGFFGEANYEMGIAAPKFATTKVATLKVDRFHNCCGSCAKAITAALESVAGVKAVDVQKGYATLEGDFVPADVMTSLRTAGVSAQIAREQ